MGTVAHVLIQGGVFVDTKFNREAEQPGRQFILQDSSPATFRSLLKQYGREKALDNGKLLHAHICKLLGVHNTFLGNCLVEMYGDCGDVLAAASTFDLISEWNLCSWNILINAYAKNGYGNEALCMYQNMKNCGFSPTPRTFVCLLNAFNISVALTDVWEIHSAIVNCGYTGQVIVCTALINVYGKAQALVHANIVFDDMPIKDVISWNAMLVACNESGSFHETLGFFQGMTSEGFEPNHITYTCVMEACASLKSLHNGKEIHTLLLNNGYSENQIVGNALLNMYGKCGSLEDARSVFLQMPHHDVFSWSSMIGACVQNGDDEGCLELFYQMQASDVEPNAVTFVFATEACANKGLLEEARIIHGLVAKSRFSNDTAVLNALITMYGKCRSPSDARFVFDRVRGPSLALWNAMISMYVHNACYMEALDLFTKMQNLNLMPDCITLVSALDACAHLPNLQEGLKINDLVAGSYYQEDITVNTALINMFGNCGDIRNAEFIFQRSINRDAILWSSMISAYTHNGCDEKALNSFYQMQLSHVVPDSITYVSALNACSNLSCLKEGHGFHMDVVRLGYEEELQVATALIDMYGKCGSLDGASLVFKKSLQRDLIMWNTMVTACAQNGNADKAIALFREMQKAEVRPDSITYSSILSACNHMGNVDDGRHLFALMKNHGIQHTAEHWYHIIDLLGRVGHIDDAKALIQGLSPEEGSKLWLVLLDACSNHGTSYMKQAKQIARHALQIDPDNPAPYILLSNMCSSAHTFSLEYLVEEGEHC